MSKRARASGLLTALLTLALIGAVAVATMSHGGHGASPPVGAGAQTPLSCQRPSLPGQVVRFTARDHLPTRGGGGMIGESTVGRLTLVPRAATVASGTVTVVLADAGSRPFRLLILPLRAGQLAGRRPIGSDDRISEAEAVVGVQTSCPPGGGPDAHPGGTTEVTLTVEPGRYEVSSNLPGDYRRGMVATLTVTSPPPEVAADRRTQPVGPVAATTAGGPVERRVRVAGSSSWVDQP